MKKPKFIYAEFAFVYGNDEYLVKFTPTEDKRYYSIKCEGPLILTYEIEASEMATKTAALFHLCRALGIDTKDIH